MSFFSKIIKLSLILIFSALSAQQYDVKIWGVPVGTAELIQNASNEISLNISTPDFLNKIYPIHINYYSIYNESNYTAIESNITSRQGTNIFCEIY